MCIRDRVPTHLLERAVTLSASGMQAAIICGPALGGVLYVLGAGWVYGTCTALLTIAFVLMRGVHDPHQPAKEKTTRCV